MVEVLKTGLYDTIQDLGRFGVQEYGVPYSGAMDLYSAKLSNAILDNHESASVLELTITGPKLLFHCNTQIVLSGADLSPRLNSKLIKMNTRVLIAKNDVLSFGRRHYGCRTYLAVKRGFQAEHVMNSYSMYKSITSQALLKKGDQLFVNQVIEDDSIINASVKIDKTHFNVGILDVFKGVEFNSLPSLEQETLFSTEYSISKDSNRMVYQVNENFENNIKSIITSHVLPGTVQLTPSGKLLILMRDCQTTGGYPRILQVSEASINQLSQKIFGQKFRFKCVD